MSALVIVMVGSAPQGEGEARKQVRTHAIVRRVRLVVRQRAVRRAVRDGVGEALLALRDGGSPIAIEQARGLHPRGGQRPGLLEGSLWQEGLVAAHGQVS